MLLAAGSADSFARVFSSFIKGVEKRPEPTLWGERIPFNTVCGEFANNSGGWVHAVGFSPSGDALAYAAHDSSVTVVYPGGPDQPPRAILSVVTGDLPFVSLVWTREDELVAGGHDCRPVVFRGSEAGWNVAYSVDDPKAKAGAGEEETSALSMFKRLDIRGSTDKDDSLLKTIHQNPITTLRAYEWSGDRVSKISSSGYVSLISKDDSSANMILESTAVSSFSHFNRCIVGCNSSHNKQFLWGGNSEKHLQYPCSETILAELKLLIL